MRNFEERKAEIFRRSEERINEKIKKRKRIISICIPLIICIGLYSIFILPAMLPASESDENLHQEVADDILVFPVSVQFIDNNGNLICSYTDSERIMQISNAIDNIINKNTLLNESADSSSSKNGYTILFKYNTDSTSTYIVSENTLFNMETGNYYILTDLQKGTLDLFLKE